MLLIGLMMFLPMQIQAQENEVYEYLTVKDDGTIIISPNNSENLIEYINQLKEDAQYKEKYLNLKKTSDQLLAVKDKIIKLQRSKINNLNNNIQLKNKKIDNLNIIIDKKDTDIKSKIQYGGSGAAIMAGIIFLANLR